MAVQFIATGITATADVATPFANQSYTLPTGHAAKDLLIAFYGGKPYGTVPSTPADWTAQSGGANGTTDMGVGTGSVYAVAFTKVHDGSESNPASTFSAQYSPAVRAALLIRDHDSMSTNWTVTSTKGSDSTATGTGFSAAGASNLSYTTGDIVVVLLVHNDDSSADSSIGVSIPGCTVGTVTQRLTGTLETGTGNDARMYVATAEITAGTSSDVPTVTATTGSGDSDGQAVFLRVQRPTRDAATSTLGDAFTGDLTKWPSSSGDISVSGGKAVLPVKDTYPEMSTNQAWFFDSIYAEIVPPTAAGSGTKQFYFEVIQPDTGDFARFIVSGSQAGATIECVHNLAASETSDGGATVWNATTHRYLRLRIDGTTVYWDCSSDASSWTNIWSKAGHTPAGLGKQLVRAYAGYYGTESASNAWVEGVNTPSTTSATVPVPDAAAITVAAPSPVVRAGSTVTVPDPATVSTAAAVPVVTGGAAVIVPDPATVSVAAPVPTLTATRSQTVVATAASVTAAAPSLTVGAGATVPAVAATASIAAQEPTVTAGATVLPDPATVTTTASAPAVTGGVTVTAPAATVTVAAPAPSLTTGAVVTAVPAAVSVSAPAPTVTGASASTVQALAATVTAAAQSPAATGGATVVAVAATVSTAAPAPTVTVSVTVAAPAAVVTVAASIPVVVGAATVTVPAAAIAAAALAPTIIGAALVQAAAALVDVMAPTPEVTVTAPTTPGRLTGSDRLAAGMTGGTTTRRMTGSQHTDADLVGATTGGAMSGTTTTTTTITEG